MGPIDYSLPGIQSPTQALMQGVQFGAGLSQLQAQRQAAEAQAATQQAELEKNRLFQNSLQAFFSNPNRKFEDLEPVLALSNKTQLEALSSIGKRMDERERSAQQLFSGQVLAALEVDPNQARKLLEERITAESDPGKKQTLSLVLDAVKADPAKAAQTLEIVGASQFGKDWYESIAKVREERRNRELFGPTLAQKTAEAVKAGVDAQFAPAVAAASLSKAQADAVKAASDARFADALNQAGLNEKNWNVQNVQNQITVRSRALQLDETKTAADVQLTLARVADLATGLPDQAKKDINTAAVTAGTAKQQSQQFNSLANKIDEAGGGFGVLSRANEFLRSATGNQDYVSQLRQEYTRLRNSAAVQSLPPGPATDRDIALVLEGFPPPTADAKVMSSFLRGMAKLQDINAATENARVDWLSQNRGLLGRAGKEFQAGEFAVKPGETWVDLSQRIASDVSSRYSAPPTAPQSPAAPPAAGGGVKEGARSRSASGRPITFRNGQWVYD